LPPVISRQTSTTGLSVHDLVSDAVGPSIKPDESIGINAASARQKWPPNVGTDVPSVASTGDDSVDILTSERNSRTEDSDVDVAPQSADDNGKVVKTNDEPSRTGADTEPTSVAASKERLLRRSGETGVFVKKAAKSDLALDKARSGASKTRVRRNKTNNV